MYHSFSPMFGLLGCFQYFSIAKNTKISKCVHKYFYIIEVTYHGGVIIVGFLGEQINTYVVG